MSDYDNLTGAICKSRYETRVKYWTK